ncbi:MAG: hypothetical protein HKP22_13380 [Gammaproteobacteria bacterium]|nr:hypothetical protein [Gammaproteobacteria bacterium]
MLIEQLNKNNIPFKYEPSGNIKYPDKYYNDVTSLVRETIFNDLPSNRSIEYTSPQDRDKFINKLKESNIQYSIKHRDNGKWVIWEEKDSEKVKEITTLILHERMQELEKIH